MRVSDVYVCGISNEILLRGEECETLENPNFKKG